VEKKATAMLPTSSKTGGCDVWNVTDKGIELDGEKWRGERTLKMGTIGRKQRV